MARCFSEGCHRWRPDWLLHWNRSGLVVDGGWFCSAACVEADASARLRRRARPSEAPRQAPKVRLGVLMLQQGTITPHQLSSALRAQAASGLRLGAQIVAMGCATHEAVLRALSTQSGVRYLMNVDVATVRRAPGGLTPVEARTLGIVPLREDGGTLLVACAAPAPMAAMAALRALTSRQVEPFLVSDDDFAALVAAYGTGVDTPQETGIAKNVRDGAARIAAFAASAGEVTVTHAHVEPFTWVRVAADGRMTALLVPNDPALEEDEWLAATTRH